MCEHGDQVLVNCLYTENIRKDVPIDSCISNIVKALSDANIPTYACCCGHGEHDGYIVTKDRILLVLKKNDTFQQTLIQYVELGLEKFGIRDDAITKKILNKLP